MERPILFSAPMVRAILDGKKTQTRRVVRAAPENADSVERQQNPYTGRQFFRFGIPGAMTAGFVCPYGQPGDRLWVRETWAHDALTLEQCRAAHEDMMGGGVSYGPYYRATEVAPDTLHWRSPRFMPRWASRLALEVTNVRVERLQDISDDDAREEGVENRGAFAELCESIDGAGSCDANPWVWVVEFKRVGVP